MIGHKERIEKQFKLYRLDEFFRELLVLDPDRSTPEGEIIAAYAHWSGGSGLVRGFPALFRRFLACRGYARVPGKRIGGVRVAYPGFDKFFAQVLVVDWSAVTSEEALLRSYERWRDITGAAPIGRTALRDQLRLRGHERRRVGGRRKAIAGIVIGSMEPFTAPAAASPPIGSSWAPAPQSRGGERRA